MIAEQVQAEAPAPARPISGFSRAQQRGTEAPKIRVGFRPTRADWIYGALLALTAVLWFAAFPVLDSFDDPDIAIDAALLVAALVGHGFVKKSRLPTMELGWKILTWTRLICLLDCFTDEVWMSPVTVGATILFSQSVTVMAVMWGLHLYLGKRRLALQHLRRVIQDWRLSESRYAGLVNAVDGVVWEADPETLRLRFVSRKAEEMLGYPVSRWLEEPNFLLEHTLPEDRQLAAPSQADETQSYQPHALEYRMVAADGRIIWVRNIISFALNPDGSARACGVIVEIGAAKELEKLLRAKAMRDDLTGLPSRSAFLEALQALGQGEGAASEHVVMFLDLDGFKLVNDSLGHNAGDKVLIESASRIARAVAGAGYVARLGGDEFAVLSTELRDERQALELAAAIRNEMAPAIAIDGHQLSVSVSIGIAIAGPGAVDPEEFLSDADIAMYSAKKAAKGSARVFRREMRNQVTSVLKFEEEIHAALERNEFELQYQPIIELDGGEVIALEALLRWRHPERGLLPAAEFLPQAEARGLSGALEWKAVGEAFNQSRVWSRAFRAGPLVSVNISERMFSQPDFLDRILQAQQESGAAPNMLILEITEDVIKVKDETGEKLRALKRAGYFLALDDFGVGRSSLSRLLQMPIDMIKLDRTFVPSADRRKAEPLVRSVLSIGRDLGMSVVAEGIETREQCQWLRDLGCSLGQGYLICPPVPADQAEARILAYAPDEFAREMIACA